MAVDLPLRELEEVQLAYSDGIWPDATYTDALADGDHYNTRVELINDYPGNNGTVVRGRIDGSALPSGATIIDWQWFVWYRHFDTADDASTFTFYHGAYGLEANLSESPALPPVPGVNDMEPFAWPVSTSREILTAEALRAGDMYALVAKRHQFSSDQDGSEYWVGYAALRVEYTLGGLPPQRIFPRDDALGMGSPRIFPQPKSQQGSNRLGVGSYF